MRLILQVENPSNGKVTKINLKAGVNVPRIPRGGKVEVIDEETGQVVRAAFGIREGADARLFFGDGEQIEVRLSNVFTDGFADYALSASGDAPVDGGRFDSTSFAAVDGSASGGGSAAAATASSGGSSTILIVLGLLGGVGAAVAAGGGGGGGSSGGGTTTPAQTQTPAPTVALGTGISGGATAAEATASGGAVTVSAVSGANVSVTFSNGGRTVTKSVTGTGSAQPVTLTAADLQALGDGPIAVSATATVSGQTASSAATASFTLDTLAPGAPQLVLGTGVAGGATAAEATAGAGVVTVAAEAGSSVQITFTDRNGVVVTKSITATGAAQPVVLTAIELGRLSDGEIAVSAVATDAAGNAGVAAVTSLVLDTLSPVTPTLAQGAGLSDGASAAEATAASGVVTVSGEAGSAIVVTFTDAASHVVTKTVTGTGSPQAVVLTAADLAVLSDGAIAVRTVSSDAAGNASAAGTTAFTLDATPPAAPTLALAAGVAGGATAAELTASSGVATVSAEAGSTITITFRDAGGSTVTKTLTATGNVQEVRLAPADLSRLADGAITVSAVAADRAGNVGTATVSGFTLDTQAPAAALSLEPFAAGGVTASEARSPAGAVTLTAEAGSQVTVTFSNGLETVTKTVSATGAAQAIRLTNLDLATLGDGPVAVTATATDAAGNAATTAATTIVLDTQAPLAPVLSLATTAAGGVTMAEAVAGAVSVSGEAGATISVTFADALGHTITREVQGTGAPVEIRLTAAETAQLSDGEIRVTASAVDSAGNAAAAPATATFRLDTAAPSLRIDAIAVDDVVNAVEHGSSLIVTGTTSAENGQLVSVTLGNATYAGLAAGGTWLVSVPAADVAALLDGQSYQVRATVSDAAGNVAVQASRTLAVDLAPPAVAITSPALTGDSTPVIAGTAPSGTQVTVTVAGATYVTTAVDGGWAVDTGAALPASGALTINPNGANSVSVVARDPAGNTAAAAQLLVVDTTAPTLAIAPVSSDGVLNAAELGTALTISGTATGAEDGRIVTVRFNGVDYAGQVTAGAWSVTVPQTALAVLADGASPVVRASLSDAAGNAAALAVQTLRVDSAAPTLTIDPIAGDGVISAAESGAGLVISGRAVGAEDGQVVSVRLNDKTYAGIVSGGGWSVAIGPNDVSALADGQTYTVLADVRDAAGNPAVRASGSLGVDLTPPAVPVLSLGTGVANGATAAEAAAGSGVVTVTGQAGSTLQVSFTDALGMVVNKTLVATGSAQAVTLTAAEVASLSDGQVRVSAVARDAAGNASSAGTTGFTLDKTAPAAPTLLSVSPDTGIAGDGLINTGTFTLTIAAATGSTVQLFGNNGAFKGIASESSTPGIYTIQMAGMGAGTNNFTAVATDAAGNASAASAVFPVTIDPLAPDAPVVTLAAGVGTGATLAEATAAGGVLTVSAEAASTVSVVFTNTANTRTVTKSFVASGTAQAVTLSAAEVAALGDGPISVIARATDAAGNATSSAPAAFVLDTVAPTIAMSVLAGDAVINAAERGGDLVIAGTTTGVENGRTVTVTVNGSLTYPATVTNGAWSVSVPAATVATLADGQTHAVTATVSDAAGNPAAQASQSVRVDATPPQLTIDPVALDGVINAAEHGTGLVVSGTTTAENGRIVSVSFDGRIYAALVQDGTWSVAINASDVAMLAEGANVTRIRADVSDAAGNPAVQAGVWISVDLTAPVAPAITAISQDTGLAGDRLTSDRTLTVSGTAEANATVAVYDGSVLIGTVRADAQGNWTLDHTGTTLADGSTHAFTARATDAAGNHSLVSQPYVVNIDAAAPDAPVITGIDNDSGLSGDGVTADATLVVSGTAEAGSTVTVFLDGVDIGTATANAAGVWSFDYTGTALVDGTTYSFVAVSADAAGNSSAPSASYAVTVDLAAPVAPTILTVSTDSGVDGDGLTNDATIEIVGTAEPFSTVAVLVDGVRVGTAAAGANGAWSFDHTGMVLADGIHTLTAVATDSAGNTGASSAAFAVVIDTAIATPVITGVSDDTGNAGDGITADATLVVSGTAEAGSTVEIFADGVKVGDAVADSQGNWAFDHGATTLADGANIAFTARATDGAGNLSLTSAPYAVRIDSTPPAAPSITGIDNDTGIAGDGLTSDTTLVIRGTAEPGSTVAVNVGNAFAGTTTADPSGNWSLDYSGTTLVHGTTYAVTAVAVDGAGNAGAASTPFAVTIDTAAPAAPSIGAVTGDNVIDSAEAVAGVMLTGTGEVGATVSVSFSSGRTLSGGNTATVGQGGTWSIQLAAADIAAMGAGDEIVTAIQVDKAGNVSASRSGSFAVDLSLTGSETAVATNPALASATNIVVTGTASDAAKIQMILSATNSGQTVFESVSLTAAQAAQLTFGANDRVTTLVITDDATVAQASAIRALVTAGKVVSAQYDLTGTAAELTSALALVNAAGDVTVTGTATVAQANALFQASNSGITTIDTVNATPGEASSMAFGTNDVLVNLNVTAGAMGPAIVDLTNVPFTTHITFDGSAGTLAQTLYVPLPGAGNIDATIAPPAGSAGVAIAGELDIIGGAARDTFVISDALLGGLPIVTQYPAGSTIDGQGGTDTLVVVGTVDISGLSLTSVETLVALPGSPSVVTVSAAQFEAFTTITGSVDSQNVPLTSILIKDLVGAGQVTTVDLMRGQRTISSLAQIYVGVNTELKVSIGSLSALGNMVTGTASRVGDANGKVTPVMPTSLTGPLDLSAVDFSLDLSQIANLKWDPAIGKLVDTTSGFHVILPVLEPDQSITLTATQLQPSGAPGANPVPLALIAPQGGGKLVIVNDLPQASDLSLLDLSGVNVQSTILSLATSSDLSGASLSAQQAQDLRDFVRSLDEIQLNGNDLTVNVNDVSGIAIGGAGDLTIAGTNPGPAPVDLSDIIVSSGYVVDLTGITGPVTLPDTVVAGETLKVRDDQFGGASPQVIANGGQIVIETATDTYFSEVEPDFSGITTGSGGSLTYRITEDTRIGPDALLNGADLLLVGSTLLIPADLANGLSIDAASINAYSSILVTGTASADLDFSGLGANIQSIYLADVDMDGHAVTLPPVGAGQLLGISAEQADGQTLTVAGDLEISSRDPIVGGTLDLGGLTATGAGTMRYVVFDDAEFTSIEIGDVRVDVGPSATLTLSVNDADGHEIWANGSVVLTGLQDSTGHAAIDLSRISGDASWTVSTDTTFAGNLGTVTVIVDAGKILTMTAADASGRTIADDATLPGLGTLALTGTYDATVDLSDVATAIDLTAAAVTGAVGLLPTFAAGQTLLLTYDQVDAVTRAGNTIAVGAGTAVVTLIDSNPAADLSALQVTTGTVIADVANDKTFTGDFAAAEVRLLNASVLTVAAGKIDNRSVYGVPAASGRVVVTGDAGTASLAASISLAAIQTSIDLMNVAGLTVDATSAKLTDSAGNEVTLGNLATGQTLWLGAAQLVGGALALTGTGGTLDMAGDLAGNVDLSGVADAVALSLKDGMGDNAPALDIGGYTLTAKAAQVSGQTITADAGVTGLVALVGNAQGQLGGNVDLTGIKADIDLTAITGLAVGANHKFGDASGSITFGSLIANQTVTVNASQLAGALTLTGAAGSALEIVGDISADTSLVGVADAIAVDFQSDGIAIDGARLTAKAGQISGVAVTNGTAAGTLAVEENTGTGKLSPVTDLLGVAAHIDLSGLAGVSVSGGASLGYLTDGTGIVLIPTLGAGQTLTITGAQAHGATYGSGAAARTAGLYLTGSGTLVIEGDLTAGDVDLTSLAPTISVGIDGSTVTGSNLILTAAQADGNTIASDDLGRVVIQSIAPVQGLSVTELQASLQTAFLPVTSNIADTAANLAAPGAQAALAQVLQAYATITATTPATAEQAAIFAGSSHAPLNIVYAVRDTAANLAASADAVLALATSVTAATSATAAEAVILDGFATANVTYAVSDSAANIAAAVLNSSAAVVDAALAGASRITVTGTATFAQAAALSALSSIDSFAISGTAAEVSALLAQNNGSTAFLGKATSVYVSGSLGAADAKLLLDNAPAGVAVTIQSIRDQRSVYEGTFGDSDLPNGVFGLTFTGAQTVASAGGGNSAIYNLSDTATNVVNAGTAILARVTGIVTITDFATISQAQTLAYRGRFNNVNGVDIVYSVKDTAANIASLLYGSYQNLPQYMHGSFYATDIADAATGSRIAKLAALYPASVAKFNVAVQDTAAALIANFNAALLDKISGSVTVTGTVTAAEAASLVATFGASTHAGIVYSIQDTIANIMAVKAASGAAFLNKAANITVTDTVTLAQADALTTGITNSGTTTFAAMADTEANIATATANGLVYLVASGGTITATATDTEDLSNVSANIDLTAMTGLGTNASGQIQMSGVSSRSESGVATVTTYTVTLPAQMAANRTLLVTSAQLSGTNGITLGGPASGTAHLNIANDIAATLTLLGVGSGVAVAFRDGAETGAYGTVALSGATARLIAYEDQLSGRAITGSGTVVVHGRGGVVNGLEALAGDIDISGIAANIDLTGLDLAVNAAGILADANGRVISTGANGALELRGGQTISLTQSELLGQYQLAVSGTGVINLRGDVSASLDLTYLATVPGVSLSFLDPGEAGTYGTLDVSGTIANPATLTLAASQASNQVITGTNSTVLVPYRADAPGTNVSATTNLAQVASTLYKSAADWASGWTITGSGGSTRVNAQGQVVLQNAGNNTTAYFQFVAPAAGIYSFTFTYSGNNYGSQLQHTVNSTLDGTAINTQWNYYDTYWVSSTWGNVAAENIWGGTSHSGTMTVSLAQGQSVTVQLTNRFDRTAGVNGWMSKASELTITSTVYNGGYSRIGGTSQGLDVEVGTSTDLTAGGALAFAPVDRFILENSGTVLKLTPFQATSRVVTTSDGFGSVLVSTWAENGYFNFTTIGVPLAFESNTLNIRNGWAFLTPAQANGVFVNDHWNGSIMIVGPVAAGQKIDLTRISQYINYTTQSATHGNSNSIALGAGSALIETASQVGTRWLQVSNVSNATPGTFYIVGDVGANGALELRNVTASLSFYDGVQNAYTTPAGSSQNQGVLVTRTTTEDSTTLGTDGQILGSIGMGGNALININGYQVAGQKITGSGSNQVYVFSTMTAGADLSRITTSINLSNVTNLTNAAGLRTADTTLGGNYVNLALALPTVWNSDQVLTLNGTQANNLALETRTADGGRSQVLVTAVNGLMDAQGNITADFTKINAADPTKVTLEFTNGYNVYSFSGSFGDNRVLINEAIQVKMTGAQADGVYFASRNRNGAIGITGITGDTDLTNTINTPTIPFSSVYGRVNIDLSYAVTGGTSLNGNAVSWVWADATSGFFEDSAGHRITLPTFSNNALIVDFRQLSRAASGTGPIVAPALNGTAGSTLIVKGAIAEDLDVTALDSDFAVRFGSVVDGSQSYVDVWNNTWGYTNSLTTTIASGKTLAMRANQTYGQYFWGNYPWGGNQKMLVGGTGTLLIAGGFASSNIVLGGVTANIDLRQIGGDASTVYINSQLISYSGAYHVRLSHVAAGQTIYVNSYQLAGTTGIYLEYGANPVSDTHGVLHITGDIGAGFRTGTLDLLSVAYGIDVKFVNDTVALANGNVLKMRLDQAATFAVTGAGGFVQFNISAGDADAMARVGSTVDLSAYRASLDFTALATRSLTLNADGQLAVGSKYVILPTLISGQTVAVTASELGGRLALDGVAGSTLNVQGNLTGTMGAVDLTGVADAVTISFLDTNEGGSGVIRVTDNTLTIKPGHVSGRLITSNGSGNKTGTVILAGGTLLATGTELANIGANVDLTQLANLTVNSDSRLTDGVGVLNTIVTQIGQTYSVLASQLAGGNAVLVTADINGGGYFNVKGDVTGAGNSIDLSKVADGVRVTFADTASANIAVTDGNTLTLKAVAANGKTITSDGVDATSRNSGTVIVVDNATGNVTTNALTPAVTSLNLASITADIDVSRLAGLHYNTATAKFTDGVGTVTLPSLAAYQTLWMQAGQLAGVSVLAGVDGSVLNVVTDYGSASGWGMVTADTDLRGIADGIHLNLAPANGSSPNLGLSGAVTLTIKATHVDGLQIGGLIDGSRPQHAATGTVAVAYNTTGNLDAAVLDLRLVAMNLDLTALNGLTVDGAGLLSDVNGGTVMLSPLSHWQTLSLTSAQLAGGALVLGGNVWQDSLPTLSIKGDIANDVDLSAIGDSFRVLFTQGSGSVPLIDGAHTLTIKSQAVSGRAIASTLDNGRFEGSVKVVDLSTGQLGGTLDLRGVSANLDLSLLQGLVVNSAGALEEAASGDDILIAPLVAGQTLTVAANLLTGNAFALNGDAGSYLNVTGDLTQGGTIDLTQISGASISFYDAVNPDIDVSGGGKLKLTGALADGITVTSTQANGRNTGTVIVSGSLANGAATSLSGITANIDLTLLSNVAIQSGLITNALTGGYIAALSLVAGQTLSLTAEQLATGTLTVGSTSAGGILDIRGDVRASIDLTGLDSGVLIEFSQTGGQVPVLYGSSLTVTAMQASGLRLLSEQVAAENTGTVIVTGALSANADYGVIAANLDLRQVVGLSVDALGQLTNGTETIALPTLTAGQTVYLAAGQLTVHALALGGTGGTLVVAGDVAGATNHVDLTGVGDLVAISFRDGSEVAGTIAVQDGNLLAMKPVHASGKVITGAGTGTLVLYGALAGSTDLTTVSASISLTPMTTLAINADGKFGDGTNAITLGALVSDQTLTAMADQLDGHALLLDAAVGATDTAIVVQGGVSAGKIVDLTAIDADIAVSFLDTADVAPAGEIDVAGQMTLTIAQASGQTITQSGGGAVTIVAGVDGQAAADLSAVAGTLSVKADVELVAVGTNGAETVLGTTARTVTVDQGKTLTASADIVARAASAGYYHTVTGAGTLALTGDSTGLDLSHLGGIGTLDVRLVSGTIRDALSIFQTDLGGGVWQAAVADNQMLVLDAMQLDGQAIVNSGLVGAGSAIVHANVAQDHDFTQVVAFTVGELVLRFDSAGTLAATQSNGELRNFNAISLAVGTTQLTAEQADDIAVWRGEGGVTIVNAGHVGAYQLYGTNHADVIHGSGSGDQVFLDQAGIAGDDGIDILALSGLGYDFRVEGFDIASDRLDFSAITGQSGVLDVQHVEVFDRPAITGDVLAITDISASDAQGVFNLFNAGSAATNLNSKLAAAQMSSAFLLVNDGTANDAANIWKWTDTSNDHRIQANELTMMASLNHVSFEALAGLQTGQIIG